MSVRVSARLAIQLPIFTAVLASAACGPSPRPTSTTPLTPGSASMKPSPVTAETVPKSTPPATAPASSM